MRRSSHRLRSRKHSPAALLRLVLEQLEDRCVPSVTGFRPIDEVGNNVANPFQGVSFNTSSTQGTTPTDVAGGDLLRIATAQYINGVNTASLTYGNPTNVAGPRLVSNDVSNQAVPLFSGSQGSTDFNTVNQNGLSDFGYTFGQFIDHDMDLTPTLSGNITAASWSAGVATITVADGLFRTDDTVKISGMVSTIMDPNGFGGDGFNGTFTITASTSTTFTYSLPTDPGTATTFGKVANNTLKDGANGFPIPVDTTHDGLPTPGIPGPELVDPIGTPGAENVNLAFTRSQFDTNTGTTTPREQVNVSTSFLDLSQVYGSTQFVSDALRTGAGGKLKSSAGANGIVGDADDLLPFNTLANFSQAQLDALGMGDDVHLPGTVLFAAGDPRANETTELTSLQTLFMRNHNRLAALVAPQFASITDPVERDEAIFQEARKLNIAQYQNIVYNGYLAALLGPTALDAYTGYQASVDPRISTEFSTLAFRFGHSLLNNNVARHANDGTSVGDISLAESFFNPTLLTPGGVDFFGNSATDIGAVLKGDADNNAQANDVYGVSSIRNLLFGAGGQGEDLIARDMWRVDDHGIGDYNHVRAAFFDFAAAHGIDLSPITDTGGGPFTSFVSGQPFHGFEQISSDATVVANLALAFTGPTREAFLTNLHHGGNIHPFIAGLAEDHVPGSDLGPLFHTILVDQFERLRDGDRFFYLNHDFTAAEQSLIGAGDTLTEVIKANTTITNLQADVFRFLSQQDGKGKGFYGNDNGQVELTGSHNGTTLTTALYNSLVTALANPDHAGFTVLVDKHGDYVSASSLQSYNFVRTFLQNVSDDNVANKLSVQLLVTEFNVLLGKVDATASIHVPSITLPPGSEDEMSANKQQELKDRGVSNPSGIAKVQDIMNAAIASLRAHPDTSDPGDPDRLFQRALKGCLAAINSDDEAIFILN